GSDPANELVAVLDEERRVAGGGLGALLRRRISAIRGQAAGTDQGAMVCGVRNRGRAARDLPGLEEYLLVGVIADTRDRNKACHRHSFGMSAPLVDRRGCDLAVGAYDAEHRLLGGIQRASAGRPEMARGESVQAERAEPGIDQD